MTRINTYCSQFSCTGRWTTCKIKCLLQDCYTVPLSLSHQLWLHREWTSRCVVNRDDCQFFLCYDSGRSFFLPARSQFYRRREVSIYTASPQRGVPITWGTSSCSSVYLFAVYSSYKQIGTDSSMVGISSVSFSYCRWCILSVKCAINSIRHAIFCTVLYVGSVTARAVTDLPLRGL